jgi:arylsulfatase A-like enzyme
MLRACFAKLGAGRVFGVLRSHEWLCVLLQAAVLCCALSSCHRLSSKQPNILLITIDSLRADRLSVYGFTGGKTEAMDRLASEGVVFDAAYCDVTWTTPSMASTLTGTYSYRHRLRSNYNRLTDAATTVTELLKGAGYATGAVVGSYPVDSIYKLDQGFDRYDDDFTAPSRIGADPPVSDVAASWGETPREIKLLNLIKTLSKFRRTDPEVTEAGGKMLEQLADKGRPFFLWVHYFGPHFLGYVKRSDAENERRHVRIYQDKVINSDRAVGGLLRRLDALGLSGKTLVILHADHGESLREHRFVGHGVYLYEPSLRVPLIMRWPGRIPRGKRVSQLVGNVDIAATMLDAAGVGNLARKLNMDGNSVLPAIDEGQRIRDSLYLETCLSAHEGWEAEIRQQDGSLLKVGVCRQGILRQPWKYIQAVAVPLFDEPDKPVPEHARAHVDKQELYRLDKDAAETQSVAGDEESAAVRRELEQLLEAHTALASEGGGESRLKVTDDHLEKLRGLGYVR